jgi:hypothetical protein
MSSLRWVCAAALFQRHASGFFTKPAHTGFNSTYRAPPCLSDSAKKGLQLPIESLMGHMITPANAFARQFDPTWGSGNQQMDLVLFLDGD